MKVICSWCYGEYQVDKLHIQKAHRICLILDTVIDKPCAFCGKRQATHTTSADDATCERCYTEFEEALEGDSGA